MENQKKIKINVGCGNYLLPGFINVDAFLTEEKIREAYAFEKKQYPEGVEFVKASAQELPFPSNYADYIESVDMIEHLPMREVPEAIKEMRRVLKPGGMLRLLTVDFDDVARVWLESSKKLEEKMEKGESTADLFDPTHMVGTDGGWEGASKKEVNRSMMVLFGNQFHPGEIHMSPFTPSIMFIYLTRAKFEPKNIKIITHGRGSPIPSFSEAAEMDMVNLKAREEKASKEQGAQVYTALINNVIVAEAIK